MPHFGPFMERAAIVEEVRPVWPALTYSCHTSILTGCYVARHGITHNLIMQRGGYIADAPWHHMKSDVKVPMLPDVAKANGKTTCSLSWPVTGGADWKLNMPMIVPYNYNGWEPEKWLEGTSTQALLDRYFYKHGRFLKGPDRSLDLYTMGMALDILENEDPCDITLVKMCDLDTARHIHGVHHQAVSDQLRKHDEEFGAILEALRRKGTLDSTNIVILGDHGQTDVEAVIHLNVLLRDQGYIRLDKEGNIQDYDALIVSTGLCAYVELGDPDNQPLAKEIRAFLESLKDDPDVQLAYVLDKEEALERYRVAGPFDFIIESRRPVAFGEEYACESLYGDRIPGSKTEGMATHGGSPERAELTTFLAAGPDIRPGVVLPSCSMVDEAPTMAAILGFEMPDVDGQVLREILK